MKLFKHLEKNRKKEVGTRDLYEKRHKEELIPVSLIVTICKRHQENFFTDKYSELGAGMSVVLYGYSQPPEELIPFLGDFDNKRTIILTPTRTSYVNDMLKEANKRFQTSANTRGIAFSFPIPKISGIAPYKFFSDMKKEDRLSHKVERNNEDGK